MHAEVYVKEGNKKRNKHGRMREQHTAFSKTTNLQNTEFTLESPLLSYSLKQAYFLYRGAENLYGG